jgi:fibronectin-binding autotransporter adhesin
MKKITPFNKIKASLVFVAVLCSISSYALTYTASTTGNWSSSATWVGGLVPAFNITADAVIIPNGVTVTLDGSATFTGAAASLEVEGALAPMAGKTLTLGNQAALTGGLGGNISVPALNLQSGSNITFSGTINVDTFTTAVTSLQLVAMVTVARTLNLAAGTLNVYTAGGLTLSTGATINVSGGLLTVTGGALGLMSSYNVTYSASSAITGLELSGAGLNNITVAVPSGNTVTMTSDLSINGTLSLVSGGFVVGANTLTINGNVGSGGNGNIQSSVLSKVYINTQGGITGPLNFGDSSSVFSLIVNTGANGLANISGNLSVMDSLNLITGILSFDSINLLINSEINGSGTLSGDSLSNITLTSLSTLNFASHGQKVNNLTINTGFGGNGTLATNLTVEGSLNLVGYASLNISGDSVIINGNMIGTGTLMTDNNTALTFNTNTDIISPINIISASTGSLGVNIGAGHSVDVSRGLNISNQLNLQSGTLNLMGANLTVSGGISSSGGGNLLTSQPSNITINTPGGTGGVLNFASGTSLNNLVVNVGIGGQAPIGGQINVVDTLALISGTLNIGTASLTISGTTTGTGAFSGTDSSNLTINVPGGLSNQLLFISGGQMLNNFVINTDSGSSVTFGTVLKVNGTLSLSTGSQLNISQDSLILNGNLAGAGLLIVNTATSLIINANSSLSSQINLWGTLGTFEINNAGSQDSVVMGTDLNVANTLSLQTGLLVLNGHNLTVTGNIAAGGGAHISSNSTSDITINTTGSVSGGLNFTNGANTVNNFRLHATGSLMIGSNLIVDSTLELSAGTINIGNDTLVIANSGTITGANSTAYVMANGTGALGMYLAQGSTAWVNFEVGTNANYAPVAMQLNAGSDGGWVYASVDSGVLAQGTTGASLSATRRIADVTWMVEPTFTSNVNVNLMTMWPSALEVNGFNRDSAYISHYTNGSWDQSAYIAATAQVNGYFSLQRNGITSFSPFAVFGTPAFDTTTTAINEIAATSNNFEIYPNPATDYLAIKNIAGTDNVNIDIITITGQVIASYKLTDYTTNVSLSSLSPGNYIIKLYNSNMNEVKSFIKM